MPKNFGPLLDDQKLTWKMSGIYTASDEFRNMKSINKTRQVLNPPHNVNEVGRGQQQQRSHTAQVGCGIIRIMWLWLKFQPIWQILKPKI